MTYQTYFKQSFSVIALFFVSLTLKPLLADEAASEHYVGEKICAGCHQEQSRLWEGSHHEMAMQHASNKTVLGNFNNSRFRTNIQNGIA